MPFSRWLRDERTPGQATHCFSRERLAQFQQDLNPTPGLLFLPLQGLGLVLLSEVPADTFSSALSPGRETDQKGEEWSFHATPEGGKAMDPPEKMRS